MTPVILLALGWIDGASLKNVRRSFSSSIWCREHWRGVAGEPADHFVDLLFSTPFLFRLVEIVRIDAGEAHFENTLVAHETLLNLGELSGW